LTIFLLAKDKAQVKQIIIILTGFKSLHIIKAQRIEISYCRKVLVTTKGEVLYFRRATTNATLVAIKLKN